MTRIAAGTADGRQRVSPIVAKPLALLTAVTLAVTGCGTIAEQVGGSPTSTIPDATTSTVDAAQASAGGDAQIELLDPADDQDGPGGVETETVAGEDISARYSIVAEATVPAVIARTAPDPDAAPIEEFVHPTASGSPLVFRSVDTGTATSPDWIEVQLPIQPNGSTGWILRSEVTLSDNPYRVEVSRADYSLRVFHLNQLWVETPIAVGNGETPTPVGDFYLLELLSPSDPSGPYGPFAFGLSGFSEVLTSFGGADTAIIGLHGTNDPTSLGTDVSHGCIRLENQVIEQLAEVLPLGTPVSIT